MADETIKIRRTPASILQRRAQDLPRLTPRSTPKDVINVFTPNLPIRTPARFAGRVQPLTEAIVGLLTEGADIVIYGERGCGKSSLAYIVHDLARGNLQILDYYPSIRDILEKKGFLATLPDSHKD